MAATAICGQGWVGVQAGAGAATLHGQERTDEGWRGVGEALGGSHLPSLPMPGGAWAWSCLCASQPGRLPCGGICCWIKGLVTRGISLAWSLQTGKWDFTTTPSTFTKACGRPGEVQSRRSSPHREVTRTSPGSSPQAKGEEAPCQDPLSGRTSREGLAQVGCPVRG